MGWVLFYDAECGICSRSVRLVFAMDGAGVVDFAPLQGELARDLDLTQYAGNQGGTMVTLREEDGTKFYRGDAVIELGNALGGVWGILARAFGLFPRKWRDAAYEFVAGKRHLLGSGRACKLPEEGLRNRMRE